MIGGGPSGSSAAIGLAGSGMNVAVIERKAFPREVMCGEFLSREVIAAVRRFGLYEEFLALRPNRLTEFSLTAEDGVRVTRQFGFEAWSLKRSLLDQMLLQKAEACGARIIQPATVLSIHRVQDGYEMAYSNGHAQESLSASIVVAAYGKQNPLDKSLKRAFVSKRSGKSGVKYHIPRALFAEIPAGTIQLFLAHGVYCGVNCVNENEVTVCSLVDGGRNALHPNRGLEVLLENNRKFRGLFRGDPLAEFPGLVPYGSGHIYFGKRSIVENGVFMIGDAAAVIAPLAGDGIGMAIESGLLLAHVVAKANRDSLDAPRMEALYTREWKRLFRKRLTVASYLQEIALRSLGGNLGGRLLNAFPLLTEGIIRGTRG